MNRNYVKARPVPVGAKLYSRVFINGGSFAYSGGPFGNWTDRPDIAQFFADNPRVKFCIAADLDTDKRN